MDSSQTRKGPPHVEAWIRAERLCEMKIAFLSGGWYNVQHWMDRFNVSEQTVRNDLKILGTKLKLPLVRDELWHLMDETQKLIPNSS